MLVVAMKCRICGNQKDNRQYDVKEMMYGYRDIHPYFQCSKCGCLQVLDITINIQKYYDATYYSYQPIQHKTNLKRLFIRLRNRYALFGRGLIGRILYSKYPTTEFNFLHPIWKGLGVAPTILDVGCGSGARLQSLREAGFRHLLGIDPFIEKDINYENGLIIKKQSIHEIKGEFDVVMFHHSFEHVPDPIETLHRTISLLAPGGYCVIRIPTVSSYAWRHYGVNWVQLDAPRHLYLHSVESIEILSNMTGFELRDIIYDSTEFQFWGSEQYSKDIPFKDDRSYSRNPKCSIFSEEDISSFKNQAYELNFAKQGDQAIFYLKKPDDP